MPRNICLSTLLGGGGRGRGEGGGGREGGMGGTSELDPSLCL